MNHGPWKRGTKKEDWPEDAILCYGGYLDQPSLRLHTRPRDHWAFDLYQWFALAHAEPTYSDTPRGKLLKELDALESQIAERVPGSAPTGYNYFCTYLSSHNQYDIYCRGEPSLSRHPWYDGWFTIRTNGWQGHLGNCTQRVAIRQLISDKLEELNADTL